VTSRRRPAALPLAAGVEEYLAWLELDRHASAHTVAAYRGDLARFTAFAEGHGVTTIAGIDRDLLRAYRRSLSRPRGRPSRPLAPTTRQRHLVALRALLRFAVRRTGCPATWGAPSTCRSCPSASPSRSTTPTGSPSPTPWAATPWRRSAIAP